MVRFYPGPFKGLAIRLARHGCTNRPFYHIVVIPIHRARDAKPLEQIGTYDEMENKHNERLVGINFDRLKYWMSKGAFPTKKVQQILGLSGFLPIHPMTYITAKRNANKAEAARDDEAELESTDAQDKTS